MFDFAYLYLTAWLARVSEVPAPLLTVALIGAGTVIALFGIRARVRRLLHTYYVRRDWPGMAHLLEEGPESVCEECEHLLAVHDRNTGRCCVGTGLVLLAVCLALPLPRPVRALVQRPGCACRLRPGGR